MTLSTEMFAVAVAEARAKHGRSFEDASPELRLTIMLEEHGEIARAILDMREAYRLRRTGDAVTRLDALSRLANCRAHVLHEVAQLGSLCARWIEECQ